MRSDRIYLRSIVTKIIAVLFFFTALVFVRNTLPTDVFAQQTQNNTAVFSGQVIPAFIGTAYDPSYAYQRLAGMPIYVFAYDSWGGSGFVINNLAVRTQIRVDGSFQAQGLPNAANYGVYFPFALSGASVSRTDCTSPTAAPCDTGSIGVNGGNIPFRVPQLANADGIQDVFSYNLGDASAITNVNTQIAGETINLGLSFLTQETKVDIANNINTFPVVPTSTLRINTKPYDLFPESPSQTIGEVYGDDAYEIVAQRVVSSRSTPTGDKTFDIPAAVPIIRGRTTFPILSDQFRGSSNQFLNDRTFQAFAPEGIYAVTIWLAEGTTTYRNYLPSVVNGGSASSLGSSLVGFGIIRVNDSGEASLEGDWTTISTLDNYIPLMTNKFVIWGRVTEPNGRMSTEADTRVVMQSPQNYSGEEDIVPKVRNAGCSDGTSPWSYPINSMPGCGNDAAINSPEFFHMSYGIYAIFERNNVIFSSLAERSGVFNVSLSTTDVDNPASSAVVTDPKTTSEILTSDGPVEVNLTRILRAVDNKKVRFYITPPSNTPEDQEVDYLDPQAAELDIRVLNPDDLDNLGDTEYDIVTNTQYRPNSLGEISIPSQAFAPDITYQYIVTYPNAEVYVGTISVGDPDNPPGPISIQLVADDWVPFATASKQKVFGIVPARWVFPSAPETFAAGNECGAQEGTAKVSFKLSGADTYQSVIIKQGGQPYRYWREAFLADKSGRWSTYMCLPRTEPDYICSANDILSNPVEGQAPGYGPCVSQAASKNDFEIIATADGQTLSERVSIAFKPVGIAGARPIAEPDVVNFEFTNECTILQNELLQKFEINEAQNEDDSGGIKDIVNISQGVRKYSQVHLPVLGCSLGNSLAPRLESGLMQFKNQLILDPLSTQPAVSSAWNALRSVGNFFFVFILLIIAINYILGVDRKTWNLTTLLPQLIVGIILSNTSLLIVQAIMDLNNILTQWLFSITFDVITTTGLADSGLGTAAGIGGIAAIASLIGTLLSGGIASSLAAVAASGGTAIIPLLGLILTGIGALAGFLITLLTILYGRVLIIWIITIVAPIMFALSTLPWTGSLKSLWWKTLIPIAFMQTIIAMLLSVGVLLMSVPNDGGSIFASAGIFLTGLVTMFSMIKSPQLSMQLLGGGGLAGQAFGAVAGVASKLGGAAAGLGTAAGGALSLQAVSGRRAEKQVRNSIVETIQDRPGYRRPGSATFLKRIGFGGAANRIEYEREMRRQEEGKIYEKGAKQIKNAAVGSKLNKPNYYEDAYSDKGLIRRGAAYLGRARKGEADFRGQEYLKEQTKIAKAMAKVGVPEKKLEAMAAGLDQYWDSKQKFAFADNQGNVVHQSVPEFLTSQGVNLSRDRSISNLQKNDVNKWGEVLSKLNESLKAGYSGQSAETDATGKITVEPSSNLRELLNVGFKRRTDESLSGGVDIPAPSNDNK